MPRLREAARRDDIVIAKTDPPLISVVAAGIYAFASMRLPILIRQWLIMGVLFGGACDLFLMHIVGPLAGLHMQTVGTYGWWANLIANMLTFGPPISFVNQWFARRGG